MRLRIRQLLAGEKPASTNPYYVRRRRPEFLRPRLAERLYPRMPQPDPWSLPEICRVVGLSLSPESSLDPRRMTRIPYDWSSYDR